MKSRHLEILKGHNYGDLILETNHWFILLAPDQKNLGTCVVALKRKEGNLAGLKDKEWIDLKEIIKNLQSALRKAFNATMFNWGCLMNSSYRKDHPDPHVHWHFIPRYREKVEFEGVTFEDPCFGFSTMYSKDGVRRLPEYTRRKINEKIRENLEI
jgi:diadenosine tetraphosphate (Ap4A) HIT family hydrolase